MQQVLTVNAQNFVGDTALMYAVRDGDVEMVELLLEKGAKINAQNFVGDTGLMNAVRDGDVEMVELLLEKGAKINAQNFIGDTALMYAVWDDNVGMVELLLEKGADVNIKNKGNETVWELTHDKPEIQKAIKGFIIRKQKALMEVEEKLPADLAKLITEFEA